MSRDGCIVIDKGFLATGIVVLDRNLKSDSEELAQTATCRIGTAMKDQACTPALPAFQFLSVLDRKFRRALGRVP